MKELTPRQRECLAFLRDYLSKKSIPPTYQEVADAMEVTIRAASEHVHRLAEKGFVCVAAGKARSITLTQFAFRTYREVKTHIAHLHPGDTAIVDPTAPVAEGDVCYLPKTESFAIATDPKSHISGGHKVTHYIRGVH